MSAPVEFETEHFKGRIQVLFKRPPGLQAAAAEELLRGKKRQIWVALQGRVKRPIPLDDLQCGAWYTRPLQLPAQFILTPALEWLGRRLGGGLELRVGGDTPHVAGPLCSGAQLLNISVPGQEPGLFEAEEDGRLLLGDGGGAEPMSTPRRRTYFRHAAHRAGRVWSPDHVITMYYFDHSFNYETFRMAVPPFHLDMVRLMDAQPVGISLRDRATGDFLFRFEVWHRRMLDHLEEHKHRIQAHAARAAALAAPAAGPAAAHPHDDASQLHPAGAHGALGGAEGLRELQDSSGRGDPGPAEGGKLVGSTAKAVAAAADAGGEDDTGPAYDALALI